MKNKPSLFKRKNSRFWWFSWYTDEGRIQGSCRKLNLTVSDYTKSQALEILVQKLSINAPETSEVPQKSLISLKVDLRHRLIREGVRNNTIELYMYSLSKLIELLGEDYLYSDVKRADVNQLQDYLFYQNRSPNSINTYCAYLHATFERLYDDELIERNPFRKFKRLKDSRNKQKYLNEEELSRFMEVLKGEKEAYRRLIYIYIFTGRRRGEILDIERKDIDLKNNCFKVINNKGSDLKKQKLPIPSEIREDFEWFMKRNQSKKPFGILKPQSVSLMVKRYMNKAKLPESLHLHSLRHSFVSQASKNGVSLWEIKLWLGHSSVVTTEIYAHGEVEKTIDIGIRK